MSPNFRSDMAVSFLQCLVTDPASATAGGNSGGDAYCVRRDSQGRVERGRGWKEAAVNQIEVLHVVASAVGVENAPGRIGARDRGATHVGIGRDAHAFGEHNWVAGLADRAADPLHQLAVGSEIVRGPV